MSDRPSGDAAALRAAGRRVAVQAAALVAAVLALVVGVVTVVVLHQQAAATDELLRSTALSADDVGDPPPGAWIVLATSAGTEASPGLPAALASRLAQLRDARPDGGPRTLSAEGRRYRVLTRTGGIAVGDGDDQAAAPSRDGTVQVALDLAGQEAQRRRLLHAVGLAALVGLLLSAATGTLIGRRAVRPLAEALALQRRFVADASHELRTPLTLLSTRVQLLNRALAGQPEQVREDAAAVAADIALLGEVVEDLLVAADPRREDVRVPVDLAELVTAVTASARDHASGRGIELVATTCEVAVPGAPAALRRALLALVDNALDHTPDGGRVRVALERHGDGALLRVSDSGPGVAESERSRVLQRFASGGQRAGRTHSGLGLALTHDVVERHGGTLRLVPSQTGAVFEVRLPG